MHDKVTTHQAEDDAKPRRPNIRKRQAKATQRGVVSVYDSGFMLGDGVWEGLRKHNGTWAFIDEHLLRLQEAAKAIDLDIGITVEDIKTAF